jgi:hypothetical protein
LDLGWRPQAVGWSGVKFVGLTDISEYPVTRHLVLNFKFQTGSTESSLKTEHLIEGAKDISDLGGWRAYMHQLGAQQ